MPLEFWLAVAAQLSALAVAYASLLQRVARLEQDVSWIKQRLSTVPD